MNGYRRAAITLGATLAGLYTYARLIEVQQVEVRALELPLPRLPNVFDGYRLIHISDLHLDSWLGCERLRQIVSHINALQPHLIAITGDFVHRELASFFLEYAQILRELRAQDGVFAVLGNHDHKAGAPGVRKLIQHGGLTDLSNRSIALWRGPDHLHIAGLDDVLWRQHDLSAALRQIPSSAAAILLVHEPDFADTTARTGRIDLQLSGHSHGGQVVLPLIGPPKLPALGQRYPAGLYRIESMALYTNRGLGVIRPAVRFNCRPEITALTLRASG